MTGKGDGDALASPLTRVVRGAEAGEGGDLLVVSFSPLTFRPRDPGDFWGRGFFARRGIPALGLVAATPHWYPREDTLALIAAVERRGWLRSYGRIVTYGWSMGGYAALKYAAALGARRALSFVPQSSIVPEEVAGFDRRYERWYRPELHRGMAVRACDLAPESYLVVDPGMPSDAEHARRLAALGARPIVQVARHSGPHILIEAGMMGDFFALFGEPAGDAAARARRGRTVLRRARRASPSYWSVLAEAYRRRGRADAALAAYRRGFALGPRPGGAENLALRHARFANLCLRAGLGEEAAAAIATAQAVGPIKGCEWRELAVALQRSGRHEEALAAAERAAALEPARAAYQSFLARLYRRAGRRDETRAAAERACAAAPPAAVSLVLLAKLRLEAGDPAAAGAALARAEALPPNEATAQDIARLRRRLGP